MDPDAPRPDATCLNCGVPLAGPYCHACGQRDLPPDLPLRVIVREALGDLFAWDGRVLETTRTLLRQPGTLAVDWAAGRRALHVTPFRLYLICSLLYVAAAAGYEGAKHWLLDPVTIEEAAPRDRLQGWIPANKLGAVDAYLRGMVDLGTRWMFVLMPLGGFGLYVLYGLRRPNYTAHFVLAIHVFTVVILALTVRRLVQLAVVLVPPHERLSDLSEPLNLALMLLVFLVGYGYAAASIRRFYGVGWAKSLASAPAVTVAPVAGWFGLLLLGMFAILSWPS